MTEENREGDDRDQGTRSKVRSILYLCQDCLEGDTKLIDEQIYLVDMPGYGYAETSKGRRREWGEFITNYLRYRDRLAMVVDLIDLRHEPIENDKNASEWLMGLNIPYVIVGTKADKISRGISQ